jgi:hypothetical protein
MKNKLAFQITEYPSSITIAANKKITIKQARRIMRSAVRYVLKTKNISATIASDTQNNNHYHFGFLQKIKEEQLHELKIFLLKFFSEKGLGNKHSVTIGINNSGNYVHEHNHVIYAVRLT